MVISLLEPRQQELSEIGQREKALLELAEIMEDKNKLVKNSSNYAEMPDGKRCMVYEGPPVSIPKQYSRRCFYQHAADVDMKYGGRYTRDALAKYFGTSFEWSLVTEMTYMLGQGNKACAELVRSLI